MNRLQNFAKFAVSVLLIGICFQFGCRPQQPLYLTEKGRWQNHYIGRATNIEYPNVDIRSIPEVSNAIAPLTLDNPDPTAEWDLTLEEAVHMALKNSRVIRTLTGVGFSQAGVNGVPSMLLQSPGSVRTVFDPALIESDPRIGQEAALAAFDAQLNAGARWTKSDTPGRDIYRESQADVGTFNLGINKYAATGTQFYLDHVNQYNHSVSGISGMGGAAAVMGGTPPTWSSYLEGGFKHPLLRGSGIEFNRIAGLGATPGNYGGVVVARINTDQSLVDFEMATRDLVASVETAYWNLYFAYHRLDSVRSGRDAAYETWRQTKTHAEVGSRRGSAQNLAQSEQNYFTFRQQTELAQNNLFRAEMAMRYILGQAATDGRLIRPIDDPITAPISLDWRSIICEALYRSPELRKQKWEIKRRELELTASRNFLLPNLDLEAGYRVSGAGRGLTGGGSAYDSLVGGNYTGWTVGMTASAPFGWRREQAAVRNAELQLRRARAILQEQELTLTHQLTASMQDISLAHQQMQTTLAAYRAASKEVQAVREALEAEITTLDQLLQAQRRQAEAETGYYSSVIDYNLAIMTLHFRKGSLLEYNNVCLQEGPWPSKAYFDARQRARERDAGHYFNYGLTLPRAVSRGVYAQHQHTYNSMSYEVLPTVHPTVEDASPMPPVPGTMRTIETNSTQVIPAPVLPRSSGNTAVSFVTPAIEPAAPTAVPTLTPARNMRYVR